MLRYSVTVTVTVLKNHFSAFQALQYNNITVLKNQKQGGFVVYDSNSPPLSSYFQLFFVLLTIICAICRYYKYETTENNDLRGTPTAMESARVFSSMGYQGSLLAMARLMGWQPSAWLVLKAITVPSATL